LWQGDFTPSLAKLRSLFFADDTFRALESGVPLANLFNQLHANNNKVQVIAHSLGNMVVNSALTQVAPQTVTNYVMNEAAVPAEAFFQDRGQLQAADSSAQGATNPFLYGFLQAPVRQNYLAAHLAQLGQTDNSIWTQQLSQVLASPGTTPFFRYELFYGNTNPTTTDADALDYTLRWQFQPGQNYGPWLGYFAGNPSNTTIINSFNSADCVLDNVWYIKQLVQSPDRDFGDTISALNYAFANPATPFPQANRSDTASDQEWLFQTNSSAGLYGNIYNYRRWLRLAYWYPATSTAVGASDFKAVFSHNVPMVNYVGSFAGLTDPSGNPITGSTCFQMPNYVPPFDKLTFPFSQLAQALQSHLETHSYLQGVPLPAIWLGYKDIRNALYPTIPDPDPITK